MDFLFHSFKTSKFIVFSGYCLCTHLGSTYCISFDHVVTVLNGDPIHNFYYGFSELLAKSMVHDVRTKKLTNGQRECKTDRGRDDNDD